MKRIAAAFLRFLFWRGGVIFAILANALFCIKLNWTSWIPNENQGLGMIFNRADPVFELVARSGGTIFVEFQGFTPNDAELARIYYTRAVYKLTPCRVLIADPASAIFDPKEPLADNFHPDGDWLDSHHVDLVLVIRHADGQVQFQLHKRMKEST